MIIASEQGLARVGCRSSYDPGSGGTRRRRGTYLPFFTTFASPCSFRVRRVVGWAPQLQGARPHLGRLSSATATAGAFAHTKETVEIVTGLLADGDYTQNAICMTLGMSPRTVRKITRSSHFQQIGPVGQAIRTQHMRPRENRRGCYLPSPRKIERLCEQIRKTWTPEEEEQRYCGRLRWTAA